jgi:hypothetical protein
MGAYSPPTVLTEALTGEVMDAIVNPTVEGLARRGTPYQGVLYAGLMLTADGPKLVEYNARFGDPECQVMMMRLRSDLLDLLWATATGSLAGKFAVWRAETALTVIMASKGYPGSYGTGSARSVGAEGLDGPEIQVFHAGTRREGNRLLAANGGRVLNVTALGRHRRGGAASCLRNAWMQDCLARRLLPPRHRLARASPAATPGPEPFFNLAAAKIARQPALSGRPRGACPHRFSGAAAPSSSASGPGSRGGPWRFRTDPGSVWHWAAARPAGSPISPISRRWTSSG